MELTSGALTSYQTAKAEIGLTDDDRRFELVRIINAVSDAMARAADRTFFYQAGIVERVAGGDGARLVLPRAPISSVTSIETLAVDGTVDHTFSSSEYEIEDADAGFLWRHTNWPWQAQRSGGIMGEPVSGKTRQHIRVTYTAGWVTPAQALTDSTLTRDMPYDLEEACIWSVSAAFHRRGVDRGVFSEASTNVSRSYRVDLKGILLPESEQVARAYWRPDSHG